MDERKKVDAKKKCTSSSCCESQVKRQKIDNILCLPEDILCYILARLPAKCLLSSARFVCKPWTAKIHTSHFVETHLHCAKPGLFIQSARNPYDARFLEIKDSGEFEVTDLNSRYPGRFVSSCDGISLFFKYATGAIFVANPITMQSARFPDLLRGNMLYPPCAIVHVPRTGEFKLFVADVQKQSGVTFCHWYVLRLGVDSTWEKNATEAGDFDFKCSPIYTGGCDLYWITEHRVIVMDVDKATFRVFPLPRGHRWNPQYLKMGNCLSSVISSGRGFQIHIFDVESGKWTFYHQMGELDYRPGGCEVLCEFFGGWMNQELIIKTTTVPTLANILFSYNVKTKALRKINAVDIGSYDVGLHTNSLVSWKNTLAYPSAYM